MQTFDLTKAKPLPPFKRELREAIRQGRKTQTRRLPKDQSAFRDGNDGVECWTGFMGWQSFDWVMANPGANGNPSVRPAYQPGDIVYLKEPLERVVLSCENCVNEDVVVAKYKDDGEWSEVPWRWKAHHLTSIQFPREAARWFGRIKSVKVERVQSISGRDAKAEGCKPDWDAFEEATFDMEGWAEPEEFAEECDEECDWVNFGNDLVHAREHREWLRDRQEYALQLAFKSIFDACHPGAWERNEFVWVYEWEVVDG